MLEKGIYELVTQDAGVLASVARQFDDTPCVFWNQQIKGTPKPSLVMTRVTTRDVYSASGSSGLSFVNFQFDGYGMTAYDAQAVSLAVRNLLKSFRGNLPDTDATPVLGCVITQQGDFPAEQGGKNFVFRQKIEVTFQVRDTFLPVSTPNNPEAVIDGGTQ